jgi:hypothetical protein
VGRSDVGINVFLAQSGSYIKEGILGMPLQLAKPVSSGGSLLEAAFRELKGDFCVGDFAGDFRAGDFHVGEFCGRDSAQETFADVTLRRRLLQKLLW